MLIFVPLQKDNFCVNYPFVKGQIFNERIDADFTGRIP